MVLAITLTVMMPEPARADVQYIYDAAGRVVQVIAPDGTSAEYRYDAAGNITAINRYGSSTVVVTSFSPASGSPGTTVTVLGSGFNAAPAQNTVTFNGVAAAVTAATANQLVVTLPVGATTGPISVGNSAGSATSPLPFTVTTAITITSFTPTVGNSGTAVTINGTGFDPSFINDKVQFNGNYASVISASTTQIQTTVPANTGSGPISVGTPTSYAISAGDFVVPPATIAAADILSVTRMPVGAAAQPFNFATANKYQFLLIDGGAPGLLSVQFSGLSLSGTSSIAYTLYAPDNTSVTSGNITAINLSVHLPALPRPGKYILSLSTGSGTGSISAQLETNAALTADGMVFNGSAGSGQSKRYIFTGAMGQGLGLGVSNLVLTPSSVTNAIFTVYRPDNTALLSSNCATNGSSCSVDLTLPMVGTYSVLITPATAAAASFALTLSSDATGALIANGSAQTFTTTRVGQNARYTFSGTAGLNYSLLFSGDTFPGSTTVTVYKPDGSYFNAGSVSYTSGAATSGYMDLRNLPMTGTYTVFVSPGGTATGTLNTTLNQDVTGTPVLDGATTSVTLAAAQNATLTFAGTAGQGLGLGISGLTMMPSDSGSALFVYVYKPDGTQLSSCYLGAAYGTPNGNSCDLLVLPITGTYTLRLDPNATYAASFTLTLSSDLVGTLTANGSAQALSTTRVGQNARYTFSGTAGLNYSLLLSGDTFPGGTTVTVSKPDGSYFNSGTVSYTSGAATSGYVDLRNLPVTGTYTVFVSPGGTAIGTLNTTLNQDVTGAPALMDDVATSINLSAGQNATLTFAGTAGQGLGLGISGLTMTPSDSGSALFVYVYKPDGTQLSSCYLGAAYGTPNGNSCDLLVLPVTGTYTLRLDPNATYAASFTLTLSSDLVGTLTANGSAQALSTTRVGQNARYTFSGTAGLNYSLLLSGDTFPGGTTVTVSKPDGSYFNSGSVSYTSGAATSGYVDLRNLPVTGTYTVFVSPGGTATGALNTTLNQDVTGTPVLDGATTGVTLAAAQNATLTFAGTAGQGLGLGISGLVMTPSDSGSYLYVYIYKPDGSQLSSCYLGATFGTPNGSSCDLLVLPVTGIYTLRLDPNATYAASFTLTLSSDLVGTLTANGSAQALSTTRVGQNARYTFSGTAGLNYSLLLSGDTFPGGTTVTVSKPDGSYFNSGSVSYTSGAATSGYVDLRNLPVTGTYTVFVSPGGTVTGTLNTTLNQDVGGTPVLDGATTNVTLSAGQNATLTFAGTAGQGLGLGISGLTMTPSDSGSYLYVYVYKPDGTQLSSCYLGATFGTPNGSSCDLLVLPVTGTYTLRLDPSATYAASFTLTLSSDLVGTLTANSSTQTFTTARIGQNARYMFSGTASLNYSLLLTGDIFPGGTTVTVYKPDGSYFNSTTLNYSSGSGTNGTLTLVNLPVSGNYTVFVSPSGVAIGQLNMGLTQP